MQQGRAPGSLADQQGGAPGSLVDQQSRASGSLAGQGSLSKSGQPAVESVDETRRKVMLGREELSKDVEINDVKNRYIITRGATQIKIKQDTGAELASFLSRRGRI